MRIALDGTPIVQGRGGIRRYTEQLARALSAGCNEDEVASLAPGAGRWWSFGLPKALRERGVNVFHGTDFAVPYRKVCASLVTIHDLAPWRREWRGETSQRVRRRTPWLLRLGRADMVITPTEAVRREVIEHFRWEPERVAATHLGAPDWAVQERDPTGEAYFLLVGGAKRKNAAFARELCRELGIRLIEVDGDRPEEELAGLYRNAIALLMPSFYEGFGLPMIEAMHCGTPVVASKDAALQEVSGGAAVHVAIEDPHEWRTVLECLRCEANRRSVLGEAGRRRAAQFTWARCASQTRLVYEEAIGRYGR